jgi:hypothetical protein
MLIRTGLLFLALILFLPRSIGLVTQTPRLKLFLTRHHVSEGIFIEQEIQVIRQDSIRNYGFQRPP